MDARWVWAEGIGKIVAPERVVARERFDEAWYPGEAVGTLVRSEEGGITRVTQTVGYESREAGCGPKERHGEGRGGELRPPCGDFDVASGASNRERSG